MTPGKTYHIYNHGNGVENIFRCNENYRYFLQKFGEYSKPVAHIHAFCLLPNHFHFLLRVKDAISLSNQSDFKNLSGLALEKKIVKRFSNFFNAYTKAFNKVYARRGKLFLAPFQRKLVSGSRQFYNTAKYIHNNPVKHQFVDDPFDWTFSSIHLYRDKNIQSINRINDKPGKSSNPGWNDFIELDY